MARKGKGGAPRRPVKGFRPGKEPPQIKAQRAKQELGDVSTGQERLIELLAERSPEEGRKLLRRWRVGLLAAAIVLVVSGAFLFTWSLVAGIVVEVLAVVALGFWWRMHRQRDAFENMVDAVSGGGR